jgi:hypothetical protein
VPERGLHVQVVATRAREDRGGGGVDDEPDERHDEHPAAENVLRVVEPADGLDEDPDGDHCEGDAVRERGEDLRPPVAEAPLGGRGPTREPRGDERERQRGRVAEHVPGVGEQRKASREPSADDLAQRVRAGKPEDDP